MSCYHPLEGFRTPSGVVFSELRRYDILGRIEIPCGQCIGCRMRRATDWTLRCMHEASMWKANCFVTLTYGRDQMPALGSLDHVDFQLFMKRLRKTGQRARFFMCGEYGPLNLRPHYHACLFGVDFRSDRVPAGKSASGSLFYKSESLAALWKLGNCSVQDLTRETAGYCARYIMKKALGETAKSAYEFVDDDGVIQQKRPEYAAMSLKPGIGARWFQKYGRDIYPHDFVVADGVKYRPPKYYDTLYKRGDGDVDSLEFARYNRAVDAREDNTDERRGVREKVHVAKLSTLRRDYDG